MAGMSTGGDDGATRLAKVRRWRRVLAGYAAWGWAVVALAAAGLQSYTDSSGADRAVLILAALWLLTIAAWLVLVVRDRKAHPDGRTSLRAEQLVALAPPVPWVRLTACVLLAVMLPLLVQDLAAAGAGALHVGQRVPFTASGATRDKGGVLVHGYWSADGHDHDATLMDAGPAVGSTTEVRRPPWGGSQVYAGGAFAYIGLIILLAVVAAFGLLLRSTHRALVAGRALRGRIPVWQQPHHGRSGGDPSWPGLDHRVQVRPHAGTTRKGRPRRPSAYDRNVSMTASGRRFVVVDRTGHPHEFPLAKPDKREEYAVAGLRAITYTRHDSRTGDMEMKTVYVLDGRGTVLVVLPDDDWDYGELERFAAESGLTYVRRVYPTEEALELALPVLPGTLRIETFSRWAPFVVLILPVIVLFCLFVGLAVQ